MKVSGPNSGAGPGAPDATPGAGPDEAAGATKAGSTSEVGATDAAAAVERTESSGRAFAEKLAAVGAPSGPTAAARPTSRHATSAIAADLEAGRVTPSAAVDQVLEQVLARQVGADAPPAVRERVRAALREALESDPLLADKLKRLDG